MSESSQPSAVSALDKAEQICRREAIAYGEWLHILSPLRWFCVGGSAILSAAAGVTILWQTVPQGKLIAALLAFGATALTGLHVALRCDAHQLECRKLIQSFKCMSLHIAACRELAPEDQEKRRSEIVMKVANLIEEATATPSSSNYRHADRIMSGE